MPPRKRKSLGAWIDWWPDREPVDLKVEYVGDDPIFPGERFVRFWVDGKMYTGFFPERYVSSKKLQLSALIVADVEGGWLVRIPDETFQGGPQVVIPEHEQDTLIIRRPENVQNDSQ